MLSSIFYTLTCQTTNGVTVCHTSLNTAGIVSTAILLVVGIGASVTLTILNWSK